MAELRNIMGGRFNALGGYVAPTTAELRKQLEDRRKGAEGGTATAPGGPTLTGAPAFGYAGAYGGIPQVPSPGATQGAAVGANVGAMPQLFDLAGQTNVFNTDQAVAPYRANLPQYDALVGEASGNILNNMRGVLSPDVLRKIQQIAAERGVDIGSPGSPNSNAAMLQALGLTTLDLQNLAQTQLSGAVARTPVGPQFNPAAMFISPEQWQQAQAAANLYASAPIPAQAAAENLAALRGGLGAGRGSVGGGGGVTIRTAGAAPSAPARPLPTGNQYAAPTPPVAPGRAFDPNATASSRTDLNQSVFSPYSLGGYNYGGAPAAATPAPPPQADVPPEIWNLAMPLFFGI